jgi:hypothetical protein
MRRQRILERVGWTFWRCFGSNFSLDREGVLDDLFQTLERMEIKPVGNASAKSQFTEHRVIKAEHDLDVSNDDIVTAGLGSKTVSRRGGISYTAMDSDGDVGLFVGDRIVVRYLDDPRSRQEFYILTERASDPLNGLLSLSSPLALALADASPGDEVTVRIGDHERPVLYMTLEREPRQAA